jgi:hypothetical protein
MVSLGSGVFIGPTIAITARHVIDAFSHELEEVSIEKTPLNHRGQFCLLAIQFLDNGARAQMWEVHQVVMPQEGNSHDIVVMRVQATTQQHLEYEWKTVEIQLMPPAKGERIAAFGYHSTKVIFQETRADIKLNPFISNGFVEETHQVSRDRFNLPFPCFQTNARFDGGMSGGPVFTQEGYLCGIICSNIRASSEDENDVSYVSSLWPLMGMSVSFDREGFPPNASYPFIELFKSGFLSAVDTERVKVVVDEVSGYTTTSLKTT